MARIARSSSPYRVSSTLLGRVKLQQVSTDPTPPPRVPRAAFTHRARMPHKASIRDYLR